MEFAALIAIDWADREHVWTMQVVGDESRETGKLRHTAEAIEQWAAQLAERFGGRPIAVALEQSRGSLVYALSKYQHLVLFPIHPSTSKDYRKAMFPSGSKNDPKDAGILLDLVTRQRDRLRPLRPDTELTRKIQCLVEQRRQLVDQRTAFLNRITADLKLYFPQVLDWFDSLSAPMVAEFLRRWPTLDQLQKESPEQLRKFFFQHGSRSIQRIEDRLARIADAKAITRDSAVIDPMVSVVETLLTVVQQLNQGIARLSKAIDQAFGAHPDYSIFSSFPGAGKALAPRLLVAFGSDRDRYTCAQQMQAFSGIAPVTNASGSRLWIHFRWQCSKFLRQTFHEFAAFSIHYCDWAREFYDRQKAKRKGHHAAVRALAFKWIRILFRCWKSRTPYDETRYVCAQSARNHRAPSVTATAPNSSDACVQPVKVRLKKVGDFSKLADITA